MCAFLFKSVGRIAISCSVSLNVYFELRSFDFIGGSQKDCDDVFVVVDDAKSIKLLVIL